TINKNDFTIDISKYLPTYELLKTYITGPINAGISAQYAGYAKDLFDKLKDATDSAAVVQYAGSLLEWMGQASQLFLVGDPQASAYFCLWATGKQSPQMGGVLADVRQYYLQAIGLYNNDAKAAPLYKKIGTAFGTTANLISTKLVAPDDDPLIKAK